MKEKLKVDYMNNFFYDCLILIRILSMPKNKNDYW